MRSKDKQLLVFAGLFLLAVAFFSGSFGGLTTGSVYGVPKLSAIQGTWFPVLSGDRATVGSDYQLGFDSVSGKFVLNGVLLNSGVDSTPADLGCRDIGTSFPPTSVVFHSDSTVSLTRTENLIQKACGYASDGFKYSVREVNSKLVWDLQGCSVNQSEQLAVYPLSGGTTVSGADLNAIARVNRFCMGSPADVVDANGLKAGTDTQIYYDLVTKGSIIVPAGKTYIVKWVTPKNTVAKVKVNGVEILCPIENVQLQGTVISCSVQPSVICKDASMIFNGTNCIPPQIIDCVAMYGSNSHYEVRSNVGVCVTTPPAFPDCSGTIGSVYDSFRQACIYTPVVAYNCEKGGVYDSGSNSCLVNVPSVISCSVYGSQSSFDGVNCVTVPNETVVIPPISYDCSKYDSASGKAVYDSSKGLCVGFPDFTSTSTQVTVDWTLVVVAVVLVGGFFVSQRYDFKIKL